MSYYYNLTLNLESTAASYQENGQDNSQPAQTGGVINCYGDDEIDESEITNNKYILKGDVAMG